MNPMAEALRGKSKPAPRRSIIPDVMRALGDPEFYRRDLAGHGGNAAKGVAAGVMGAPVDLATMLMRPLGYGVPEQDVYGSSEYIGKRLGADTDRASYIAGLIGAPDSADVGKFASLYPDMVAATAPIIKRAVKSGEQMKPIDNWQKSVRVKPIDLGRGIWNGRSVQVLKNPSPKDLARAAGRDKGKKWRVTVADDGDLYAWGADEALHVQVEEALDIPMPETALTEVTLGTDEIYEFLKKWGGDDDYRDFFPGGIKVLE